MDNRQGMTVEPTISYTESGQEYVSDFNAYNTWGGGEFLPPTRDEYEMFDQYDFEEDPDFYDDSDSDAEYIEALDQQYADAILEANDGLYDALDWASQSLPNEFVEDYNNAIDSGDYDLINEAVERLMALYYEMTGIQEPEEYELVQDFDVSEPEEYQEDDIASILLDNGVSEGDLMEALYRLRGY
jgi:hypothetical protein